MYTSRASSCTSPENVLEGARGGGGGGGKIKGMGLTTNT